MFRRPEDGNKDWLVHFDYSLNKVDGVGTVPMEAAIYSEVFKLRPDITAAMHSHAPMCVALSMAEKTVVNMHQQSRRFGSGVPVNPDPNFIIEPSEGEAVAKKLGDAASIIIKGHWFVAVGRTIDETCMAALYLERHAKMQALSHLLGFTGPTAEFMEAMEATSKKLMARAQELGRGGRDGTRHSAEWNYYADKVRRGEKWTRGWTRGTS
jgi:ribulose-5-phosphate 4-epimerase/fuculose-1-phosphate aldolase